MTLDPLADIVVKPAVAALPKADVHLHQEATARIERLAARRFGREAFDWRQSVASVLARGGSGMERLGGVYAPDAELDLDGATDDEPEDFIQRVADTLEDPAADGAELVEIRFGWTGWKTGQTEFMALFREAERRAQARFPRLRAEAIGYLQLMDDADWLVEQERRLEAYCRAARDGLGGVDFRVDPYDTPAPEALWTTAHRWGERAAAAGLSITVHCGEFSTANLAAALRMPGLRRVGHAVFAASDPMLLEALARSGATVECCLSSNVVLGAVESFEVHPLRQFLSAGIPVTLNTDLPLHVATTIGREYAIAAALGFSTAELLGFTHNAVQASFTTAERRDSLLAELRLSSEGTGVAP